MPGKGFRVVIEGVDGSGKTQMVKAIGEELTKREVKHNLTREPTRNLQFGKIICENRQNRFTPIEEYWLFMLDRAEHWRNIYPAYVDGNVIVYDRFWHSTWVYQARKLAKPRDLYEKIDREVFADLFKAIGDEPHDFLKEWRGQVVRDALRITGTKHPDLLFILDLDPEIAHARLKDSRDALDNFETLDLLKQYQADYLELAKHFQGIILDASEPTEINTQKICDQIEARLK